jgi:hypothetical protein
MSIALTIKKLELGGSLVPYQPLIKRPTHEQGPRFLWLTPQTSDWCFPENAHPDGRISDESLAHLADQLNSFVWGQFMDWKDGIDIKRLEPHEKDIWEIRSHLKKPQLRVFGWFALPKWFVATNCALRDDLEPKSGPKWDAAISLAVQHRTALVGSVDFFRDNPGEYVKNPT